jgi:hypothetical protein
MDKKICAVLVNNKPCGLELIPEEKISSHVVKFVCARGHRAYSPAKPERPDPGPAASRPKDKTT